MVLPGFIPPYELAGLPPDTPMLLAFSGGPDSTALLSMLIEHSKTTNAPIFAAHVDHMIRENEHDRDLHFCEDTAKKYGIKLFTHICDVPREAEKSGESIELCARRIRYEFFEKLMIEMNIPLLVTAHNSDDNLETVLMSIMRGSGLHGLCGIPKKRSFGNGYVVRPLLTVSKAEIIDYCKDNSLPYVVDSTNALPDCTRNRLRLNVIPELKSINDAVLKSTTRMCDNLRNDDNALNSLAEVLVSDNGIELSALDKALPAVRIRAYFKLFDCKLEAVHVDAINELCRKRIPHSSISLPNRMKAVIESGHLISEDNNNCIKAKSVLYDIPLANGYNKLPNGYALCIASEKEAIISAGSKEYTCCLASERITSTLHARPRHSGDRIRLNGVNRSVKKLMCDAKLPLALRDVIPLVCSGDDIILIPFVCIGDIADTDKCNKKIYVTLIKE